MGWHRHFGPRVYLAGIGCALAAAATLVVLAPSAGAETEKVWESSFQAECVLAPGILNKKGAVPFKIRGEGPAGLPGGGEFRLRNQTITFTLPMEWITTFANLGAPEIKARLTHFPLDVEHGTPSNINDNGGAEFPGGAPIEGPAESGREETYTAPSEGRTISSPPVTAGGAGSELRLTTDGGASFREVSAGHYESTGEGIQIEINGYSESGELVFGPVLVSCTAPPGIVVANPEIGEEEMCNGDGPLIDSVEPDEGPPSGGTTVHITYRGPANVNGNATVEAVLFGEKESPSFSGGEGHVTAVTPPGEGTVAVELVLRCRPAESPGHFTYTRVSSREFAGEAVAGSLTVNKLGQSIGLPGASVFSGRGQVNLETGAGSVSGQFTVPAFSASLRLFGVLPVSFGLALSESGSASGTVAASEPPAGGEILDLPASFNLGVTSVGLLGLEIPTDCATAEPLSLALTDTLTREELLVPSWTFAGTTSVPRFSCEGGLLGRVLAQVLTALVSGPGDAYSLTVG